MIRPRGGDFLYSDSEIEVMKADIKMVKANGADGTVFGVLTEDGSVNTEVCMDLIDGEYSECLNIASSVAAESRPLSVTFHRAVIYVSTAFDMVRDPMTSLECLISLGFERVLTSGCDSTALEGLPTIKRLVEQVLGLKQQTWMDINVLDVVQRRFTGLITHMSGLFMRKDWTDWACFHWNLEERR
eukprot:g46075.t1